MKKIFINELGVFLPYTNVILHFKLKIAVVCIYIARFRHKTHCNYVIKYILLIIVFMFCSVFPDMGLKFVLLMP